MKKGFTLIELLAVIVILAIISSIAIPIVLSIIEDTDKTALEHSVEMYLEAVELSVANMQLNVTSLQDGSYKILNDGSLCYNKSCKNEEKIAVKVNGTLPTDGVVSISSGLVVKAGTSIIMGNNKFVYNKENIIKKDKENNMPSGKNLFDYVNNIYNSNGGMTNVINADGSITTRGLPICDYARVTPLIDINDLLEDGETYTLSQDPNWALHIQLNITNKETGAKSYAGCQGGKVTFTVDKTTKKYTINVQAGKLSAWGTEFRTITNKYQLEKGSEVTDFEPYY